jgi:hypothetical protein
VTLTVHGRAYPVVLPTLRDPRLHTAIVVITIHVLGQVWLDFRVSVPQILAAILTAATIEVAHTLRRDRRIVWPASAMLTGSGVALIMRATGTEPGDHWTFDHWYLFAGVAAFSMVVKYSVRWQHSHVFNPSNIGLVVAFLVLGSAVVEPLDFWWGPIDAPLALAFVIIVGGGIAITRRLHLLGLALAFWVTFAACTAFLAWSGHEFLTSWSASPVGGWRFWWVVVFSPELFVFVFFMITDPRTVPTGNVARIVFGAAVGIASTMLLAPQTTEFGAKVGLLSGLAVVCPLRYLMSARLPERGRPKDRVGPWFRTTFAPAWCNGRTATIGATTRAICIVPLLAAPLLMLGAPSRHVTFHVAVDELPDARGLVPEPNPDDAPTVDFSPDVAGLEPAVARDGGRGMALAVIWSLDVEAVALRARDTDLLTAVDHGVRLRELRKLIDVAAEGPLEVTTYRFRSMHIDVVRRGGQIGPIIGIRATGRATTEVVDRSGATRPVASRDVVLELSLRPYAEDRWLIVEVHADDR